MLMLFLNALWAKVACSGPVELPLVMISTPKAEEGIGDPPSWGVSGLSIPAPPGASVMTVVGFDAARRSRVTSSALLLPLLADDGVGVGLVQHAGDAAAADLLVVDLDADELTVVLLACDPLVP